MKAVIYFTEVPQQLRTQKYGAHDRGETACDGTLQRVWTEAGI